MDGYGQMLGICNFSFEKNNNKLETKELLWLLIYFLHKHISMPKIIAGLGGSEEEKKKKSSTNFIEFVDICTYILSGPPKVCVLKIILDLVW